MTEEVGKQETASQTKRHREYYRQRQDIRFVLCRQDQVDEDETEQEDNTCGVRGLSLLTCQTRELVSISLRQRRGSNITDCLDGLTGREAVGHRTRHIDRCKQVETVDISRAIDALQITELLDRSHSRRRAYIYIIKRLLRLTCLGQALDHHTIELTIGIEV